MKLKYIIITFLAIQFFYVRSFDDILESIYPQSLQTNKNFTINSTKSYIEIIDKIQNHKLIFPFNRNEKYIAEIDNFLVDSIYSGNTSFSGDLSSFDVDTTNAYGFNVNKKGYYVLPLEIPDCNGSFCRIYSCLLIAIDEKKIFFFSNPELQIRNYFRVNKKKLVYLNVYNSFSKPKFFKKWKKNESQFYYGISPLYLKDNTTWQVEKKNNTKKLIIVRNFNQDDDSKCNIVSKNW